jgi:hypothetical protein
MKRLYIITLLLLNYCTSSIAQINQSDSLFSTFIIDHFPFELVKTNKCDSEFVGIVYLSFKVDKRGYIYESKIDGPKDSTLLNILNSMLTSKEVSFSKSFRKKVKQKRIMQAIFYSYSNCLDYGESKEEKKSDECYVYLKTLQVISKRNTLMNKSIKNGFIFHENTGFFDGIVLSPCIISFNPKSGIHRKM